jgi:penicillin-binding protein 1C
MKRNLVILITVGVITVVITALLAWLRFGPIDPALLDERSFISTTVLDRNGVVLSEPLASRGNRSEWLRADALPPLLVDATIAAEDRRFRHHPGIDPIAVARALMHDVQHLRVVEGGSTITQQVAKLLLQPDESVRRKRGVAQKVRESVLALRLEHRYTKTELLALYLNLAPYGNQTRGAARAARRYFGSSPDDLTAAQAAFLAALPQRPSAYDPLHDPRRATARQRAVLARMKGAGMLDARQLASARAERLRFDGTGSPLIAPHFVERALEAAGADHPARIVTTLDAQLQREVEGVIAAERGSLLAHGAQSVAVAVLDNATGEWLAWEGSGDYFGTNFGGAIDGVVTPRQPGSTLKPFTYALGFEQGLAPASVLPDIPSHFPTADAGVAYTPRNYDGQYRGPLRIRAALAGSENVPAVAMLARVGPESLLRLLRHAGFTDLTKTADFYGLGLTLGDAEVRLDQLVAAYSALARGGVGIRPKMIRCSGDCDPKVSAGAAADAQRVLSQRSAFLISDVLSDGEAREFIFGRGGWLEFPFRVAVKTGTSQAYHDNWVVGYTRDVTVGVWVGNFDRRILRNSTGVTGAGPVFHQVMLAAMKRARGQLPIGDDSDIVDAPRGMERVPVCLLSGLRPSTACPTVGTDWVSATDPVRFCSWHHAAANGKVSVDWPDEYRAWARATGRSSESAPQTDVAQARVARGSRVKIVNPPSEAVYLYDPTLRAQFQALRLRALAPAGATIEWRVDGRHIATVAADRTCEWPLMLGTHTVEAKSSAGPHDMVHIHVK